ncbi:MAG: sll1863 family stress response protein [Planctomycetota bacterium]
MCLAALTDDLKAKYQIVQSRFDELKAAGSDKMATFKDGMESAWNEVEVAFQKLKGGGKDQANG